MLTDPSNHGHLVDVIDHSVATIIPINCHNYEYIYNNLSSVK